MGICDVLGETLLESGSTPLSVEELSVYVRENIINNDDERKRMAMHRQRQEFYQDGGKNHVHDLINKVIKDQDVRRLRNEWVEVASFNNIVKRITNEKSTVYQEPAVRSVTDEASNQTYNDLQILMRQNERARQWNRLGNLHRTILVGVRVRNIGTLDEPIAQPVFDIITPAEIAGLVTNPKDPTRLEGAVIEIKGTQGRSHAKCPRYVLWSNDERAYLNDDGIVLSITEHEIGRMPLVLLRLEEDTGSLWPGETGSDLVSAQMSIAFANLCLMKELKSATKTPLLSGDLTTMSRNQAADTELPVELGEGVIASVQDMGMDLSMFRDTASYVLETVAANNGISSDLLKQKAQTSAASRDLMRLPLRELRLEQHSPLREFERELAVVQSMVMAHDAPEYAFDVDGWSIDFADPQTPLGEREQLDVFETKRRLMLTSTVNHITESNPDLSRETSLERVKENIDDETVLAILRRPLSRISGADMGGATPADQTGDEDTDDEDNGRIENSDADFEGRGEQ